MWVRGIAYGPACLAALGHIPGGGIWGGTALPKGVFTQWRGWCFNPRYYGGKLETLQPNWFHRVTQPIRSYGISDDPIATRGATQDILDLYTAAPRETVWLDPADLGQKAVGHQGLFTRRGEAFWSQPFDWFDQQMAQT